MICGRCWNPQRTHVDQMSVDFNTRQAWLAEPIRSDQWHFSVIHPKSHYGKGFKVKISNPMTMTSTREENSSVPLPIDVYVYELASPVLPDFSIPISTLFILSQLTSRRVAWAKSSSKPCRDLPSQPLIILRGPVMRDGWRCVESAKIKFPRPVDIPKGSPLSPIYYTARILRKTAKTGPLVTDG